MELAPIIDENLLSGYASSGFGIRRFSCCFVLMFSIYIYNSVNSAPPVSVDNLLKPFKFICLKKVQGFGEKQEVGGDKMGRKILIPADSRLVHIFCDCLPSVCTQALVYQRLSVSGYLREK